MNFIETKVGQIPSDWSVSHLDELAVKITDGSHSSPTGVMDSEYKICTVKDINNKKLSLENATCISSEDYDKLVRSGCQAQYNDVLLSKDGTIGKTLVFKQENENIVLLSSIAIIRPKHNILDSEYLEQFLSSTDTLKRLTNSKSGSAIKRIVLRDIKKVDIAHPVLSEQKKIAKILSTVDGHIDEVDGMIEDLKELKKGLMQKLLTEGIGHTEFKDSEVGRIPIEWEVKTLDNLADIKRGASPRPIKDPKWFDNNSKVGWIRISDVSKSNKYLFVTEQYLSDEGIQKSRFVNKDELIMSICASVGKPIIMKMDACIHDGFVHFENLNNRLEKEYLYYFLQTQEIYFKGQGQTGTQANLNTTIVGKTLIALPSSEEQFRIVEILTSFDDRIEVYVNKLEELIQLKKGLMQQLLTGKTRVSI